MNRLVSQSIDEEFKSELFEGFTGINREVKTFSRRNRLTSKNFDQIDNADP